MRFRCIAVDREQVNLALHQNDGELGFYKFYYQLLHHWILDNEYRIFCDLKTNRGRRRRSANRSGGGVFRRWEQDARHLPAIAL